MHPPGNGATTTVNGRAYKGVAGTPVTVPDFDSNALEANGWVLVAAGGTGATATRPANPTRGTEFNDTTVGALIRFDGKTWRNAVTGGAV
jgi:hypothetical protein